jgi:glycosyltransferase involved in cell wall biosynthesis
MIEKMGLSPPSIGPVSEALPRPLWSVMIPTYNCARFLEQTLTSVLDQDRGPEQMQIEVVDDRSTTDIPEEVVERVGRGRVLFYRNEQNRGAIGNFNTCLKRARGHLVQILHGDDFVGSGYYREIEELANKHPQVGLYATRCFYVDEDSIITGVSNRIRELECSKRSAVPFFYDTPIQFAGVTVRRHVYESLGGFRSDLKHVADREMWARVAATQGGVVSTRIMAFYRTSGENDSARLSKAGENIRDVCRVNDLFAQSYAEFSSDIGRARASQAAWEQYSWFRAIGDNVAAAANWDLWQDITPKRERIMRRFRGLAGGLMRRLTLQR